MLNSNPNKSYVIALMLKQFKGLELEIVRVLSTPLSDIDFRIGTMLKKWQH